MLAVADITVVVTEPDFLYRPEYQRVQHRSVIIFARHQRWVYEVIRLGFLFQKLSLGGKDETRRSVVVRTNGPTSADRIEIVP